MTTNKTTTKKEIAPQSSDVEREKVETLHTNDPVEKGADEINKEGEVKPKEGEERSQPIVDEKSAKSDKRPAEEAGEVAEKSDEQTQKESASDSVEEGTKEASSSAPTKEKKRAEKEAQPSKESGAVEERVEDDSAVEDKPVKEESAKKVAVKKKTEEKKSDEKKPEKKKATAEVGVADGKEGAKAAAEKVVAKEATELGKGSEEATKKGAKKSTEKVDTEEEVAKKATEKRDAEVTSKEVAEATEDKVVDGSAVKDKPADDASEVDGKEAAKEVAKKADTEEEAAKKAVKKTDADAAVEAEAKEGAETEATKKPKRERSSELSSTPKHTLVGKSKDELLDIFEKLLDEKPVQKMRRDVDAIKSSFYRLHRAEVDQLRKKFIDDGGKPDDFKPPVDEAEQRFKELFGRFRTLRNEFVANREKSKQENLEKKQQVIEELKELVNSSETLHVTFNTFRELQRRWREASPIPQSQLKELWDTYNHHVENFYSYVQINKELRDLDLKRNYEKKMELCEAAEALIMDPSVVSAFHQLQKLHQEWRESGPVGKEHKEELWERFRSASARINKRHQEFFENMKEEQERNLKLKTELCVKAEEIAEGTWTTRREWNRATDKILEIQKVWRTIGFAPRKDNTKIYERFRAACDRFFDQKRLFYKELKVEMEHNLQLKTEICEGAEAIQESTDWRKTTSDLIEMQKQWKEIGPVARRHSNVIWRRFRKACDHFFNRRAEYYKERDKKYEENLKLSRALLDEINSADIENGGFDMVKEFQRRWSEIGFVPFKQKDTIQAEYKKAMDHAFDTLRAIGEIQGVDRYKSRVKNLRGNEHRLRGERDKLYNRVKQLEADIALLENNIGFFAKSKNADAMISEVREKINQAKREMEEAIKKIDIIDSQN